MSEKRQDIGHNQKPQSMFVWTSLKNGQYADKENFEKCNGLKIADK